nr:hypothetical protein [Candidatus Njordarchaeota archaeon]
MKKTVFAGIIITSLLLFSTLTIRTGTCWPPQYEEKDLPTLLPRTSPMNITVVFIGFDQQYINTSLLTWLLPQSKPQVETSSGINWGVNYSITYTYVFTNQSFRANLESYLASINVTDVPPLPLPLPNPYYSPIAYKANIFYNACSVEEYLYTRLNAINALPTNGYSAVLMNLSRPWNYVVPPSLGGGNQYPHYYNITYYDKDTGTTWTSGTGMFGQWMLGFGGQYRLWFIDLSAGAWVTPFNSQYFNYGFVPIWYLNHTYPELGGFHTKRGINFLTEYVRDFVNGMVRGLFAPDFDFAPPISDNYDVVVYAFDNCTGKLNQTQPLINSTLILSSFSDLIPYATWRVNVTYVHLNGTGDAEPYRTLWSIIDSAEFSTTKAVDFEVLWNYFEDKLSTFITVNPNKVAIPVFVIQFKDNYQLSFEGRALSRLHQVNCQQKTKAHHSSFGAHQPIHLHLSDTMNSLPNPGELRTRSFMRLGTKWDCNTHSGEIGFKTSRQQPCHITPLTTDSASLTRMSSHGDT